MAATCSPATSGSARRRCATLFLVLAQSAGRAVLLRCCRACCRTAARNPFHIAAAQGQARQPFERFERGRVRRHARAGCVGPRAAASRRSSQMVNAHPARLRHRHRLRHAASGGAGHSSRAVTAARSARLLIDQPLMPNVLADLALESEAATTARDALGACRRPGRATKASAHSAARHRRRQVLRSASARPVHAAEALECLGGNGYVEESGMPRLYREAPLNSDLGRQRQRQRLDVLRAMSREPGLVEAFMGEISLAAGADARLDAAVSRLGKEALVEVGESRRPAARGADVPGLCWARCWFATRRRRSPMPTAPAAWRAIGAPASARCPPVSTWARSSSGRVPSWADPVLTRRSVVRRRHVAALRHSPSTTRSWSARPAARRVHEASPGSAGAGGRHGAFASRRRATATPGPGTSRSIAGHRGRGPPRG